MGARSYEVARSIDAPAEVVWSLLTDAAGYERWNPAVISIEGRIEVGSTLRLVSIADPKRTFGLKVAEARAPHLLVWTDGMPLGVFRGRRTFTIVDRDGGCEFTMSEAFSGPLSGLITKAIPDLTESFAAFADGLKSAAEQAAVR